MDSSIKANKKSKQKPKFTNQTHQSSSDPDARLALKPGFLSDLYYNNNLVVDAQENIITYMQATHSNISDCHTLIPMLDAARSRLEKFGFRIRSISADRNYCCGENLAAMAESGIEPFIPNQSYSFKKEFWSRDKFLYDPETDCYICPEGKTLSYKKTDKKHQVKVYLAPSGICEVCRCRKHCTNSKTGRRIFHSVYKERYEQLAKRLKTPKGRWVAIVRKTGPETLFAEGKMFHGLRRARYRGLSEVNKQFILTAIAQNLKKLIKKVFRRSCTTLAHVIPNPIQENRNHQQYIHNLLTIIRFNELCLLNALTGWLRACSVTH